MEDRIALLESAVADLRQTVLSIEQRLHAVEIPVGAAAAVLALTQVPPDVAPRLLPARSKVKDPYDPIVILSLVGRLLLVLAGGFFLRAMTDAGTLAVPVGISCAFAYAAVWLFLSDRAGGRGRLPNAVFHALAAALLAFPLIVEATTRFKVLTGSGGAVVLSVASAALLFVAWRRRLHAVAWLTVIGALPTSAAILVQTGVVAPFALYLVAFGVATLWLGYSIDGWGGRWLAALAADMAVVGVTMRAFAPEHLDTPQVAMMLQLLLLVGYLGSIAIRTLVRGRDVTPFEAAQAAATLAVSLAGAVFMARATDGVPAALGVAALLVGAACYAAAVMIVGKREGSALNFHFYTSLALVLVLAGLRDRHRRFLGRRGVRAPRGGSDRTVVASGRALPAGARSGLPRRGRHRRRLAELQRADPGRRRRGRLGSARRGHAGRARRERAVGRARGDADSLGRRRARDRHAIPRRHRLRMDRGRQPDRLHRTGSPESAIKTWTPACSRLFAPAFSRSPRWRLHGSVVTPDCANGDGWSTRCWSASGSS